MLTEARVSTERDMANLAVYNHQRSSLWRGYTMDKCAQDLLVYQEIIQELRPAIIIEIGTWYGGSALFFASMCDMVGAGRVLSVDVHPQQDLPTHPRLTFLTGDSADPDTSRRVHDWAAGEMGIVILDSDHSKAHVLAELDAYHDLVSRGNFLIVEDTNVNGHPVRPTYGDGPAEAVDDWLATDRGFVVDRDPEPYITFAPGGYLRRVS